MNREPLRVLVIDDDEGDVVLLRRHIELLPRFDVHLSVCDNPNQVMGLLAQASFDVILMDYNLGSETGLTILRALQQTGHTSPVVFLTGQGDEELAVEALQAGAADYLPKGALSTNSLQRALTNAVEKFRLKQLLDEHRESLEAANAGLQERNQQIESFYHTVSHELRTPLTSLREFVSIVLDGLAGELKAQQREYLGLAIESCDQLGRCIDDLVEVTRMESGKLSLQLATRSLGEVVGRTVQALKPLSSEQSIDLCCVDSSAGATACIDGDRIAQIIRNLIGNSLKFTPAGGSITVRVTQQQSDDRSLRVEVEDTGRGIAPEDQRRVFERLYQVRADDYATMGGMGLGLSICHQLVVLHGGEMNLTSEPGHGSTFWFTIPRSPAPSNRPVPQEILT